MSGMLGRILREFSVTICVAILVSGFISLSLTPMLASRYLRPPHDQKHGWLYHFLGRCLDAMNKGYGSTLALGHAPSRHDDGGLATGIGRDRLICSAWCPKDLFRAKIPARS